MNELNYKASITGIIYVVANYRTHSLIQNEKCIYKWMNSYLIKKKYRNFRSSLIGQAMTNFVFQ